MLGGCWRKRRRRREDMLHRVLGCLHTLVLVLWDVSHLAFSITTHPLPALCMTPPLHLVSIMLPDQTPDQLVFGCHIPSYPAQPFYPTHRTSISWLHRALILPFFLSDLPLYTSTSALFHFSQWPVHEKRKQQCLWWESMWNKWRRTFGVFSFVFIWSGPMHSRQYAF